MLNIRRNWIFYRILFNVNYAKRTLEENEKCFSKKLRFVKHYTDANFFKKYITYWNSFPYFALFVSVLLHKLYLKYIYQYRHLKYYSENKFTNHKKKNIFWNLSKKYYAISLFTCSQNEYKISFKIFSLNLLVKTN